jgi:ribosomal protein S10
MKHYSLKITSKTNESLKNFFDFFNNITAKFSSINKSFQKKKTKKVITILKSPHVNKAAQEQFEVKIFSSQFSVYITLTYKWLIWLKKIKTTFFPGLNLKVKVIINKNLYNKTHSSILNPVHFKLIKLFRLSNNLLQKSNRQNIRRIVKQKNSKTRVTTLKNVSRSVILYSFYSVTALNLTFR